MSVGLPPDEYLDILKEHFHVTHINDVASLKFLSEHDYGEEDEPDFTLEQEEAARGDCEDEQSGARGVCWKGGRRCAKGRAEKAGRVCVCVLRDVRASFSQFSFYLALQSILSRAPRRKSPRAKELRPSAGAAGTGATTRRHIRIALNHPHSQRIHAHTRLSRAHRYKSCACAANAAQGTHDVLRVSHPPGGIAKPKSVKPILSEQSARSRVRRQDQPHKEEEEE